MNVLSDFFAQLNTKNELQDHPTLLLLNTPRDIDLERGKLPPIDSNNFFYAICTTVVGNGNLEIKTGTTFDTLIGYKNADPILSVDVILKEVSVNPGYAIDYLPGGYSGLCLLEFNEDAPDILRKIPLNGTVRNDEINDFFVLTQAKTLKQFQQLSV